MSVNLPKSKTDLYGDWLSVIVARSDTPTCPVVMLEHYCTRAELDLASTKFLFRGIVHTKHSEWLRKSGYISHTRIWELMLQRLSKLGYEASKFSMHSFRAGGATAAVNVGVPD